MVVKLGHSHRGRNVGVGCWRIFGPKSDMVKGVEKTTYWELNMYSAPNIILVIKSRRMRWVGHEAHMRESGGV
jgi:hypothetical protein